MLALLYKPLGLIGILCIAYLLSSKRDAIAWRYVGITLAVQVAIALLMLKTSGGEAVGHAIAKLFNSLNSYGECGGRMVFSTLMNVDSPAGWGFIFAVKVTTVITFLGGLMSLLSYLGVIGWLVGAVAKITSPLFGVSGAEGLCAVANSIFAQIEAPLLVKNYLPRMTRSELMTVMVSGMATTSITILVTFAAQGLSALHLFTSSIMAVPGSLVLAKIIEPETEKPETLGTAVVPTLDTSDNAIDALASGASTGFAVSGIIIAMLIVFIGMTTMCNDLLAKLVHAISGYENVTFDTLLGFIFRPIAMALGIASDEQGTVAALIGNRMIINEFVAYLKMLAMDLTPYSKVILTYLLCGFANFSSIGMQIGGIGAMAPAARSKLSQIGVRAMLGATLVNILNAWIISVIL